jgi:hypothetical protein
MSSASGAMGHDFEWLLIDAHRGARIGFNTSPTETAEVIGRV